MCTDYEAARREHFFKHYGVEPPDSPWRDEVFRDYPAPIIRRVEGVAGAAVGTFGMVPRKRIPQGVRDFDTMNARSETVAEKRSFSGAWKRLQFCLIPCEWFYEPYYASPAAKSVRWKIGMASGVPLAIAGLWREWEDEEAGKALSFTMLTVNADEHPLLKRFHKPGAEKRSVVIVPSVAYDEWLNCRDTEEARSFLSLYPAEEMAAEPSPLPPRRTKAQDQSVDGGKLI